MTPACPHPVPARGHEVWLTGWGFCTPLGHAPDQVAARLMEGPSAFRPLGNPLLRPLPAALVDDTELASGTWPSHLDRVGQLAVLAARRAVAHAGLAGRDDLLQSCGISVGNGCGNTSAIHSAYERLFETARVPGLTLLRCLPSAAASAVGMDLGLHGPVQTFSNACASSTMALGEAMRTIRHGYATRMLVGGSEAPFGTGMVKAWDALRVLAVDDEPARACRPFDVSRQGMVLGEGAVFFVLEQEAAARARGASPLAVLKGYGASSDAHHWTEPEASGQLHAMRAALADAGCAPQALVAINAHGTGTPVGDRVEMASLTTLLQGQPVPISSTKSVHGHLLGAAGAMELAACVMSLQQRRVPPTQHLQHVGPEGAALDIVRDKPRALSALGPVLSNSFAFGGGNACLVVTPPPAP